MARISKVVLDEGPLSLITHPSGGHRANEAVEWMEGLLDAGIEVVVPEIAEFAPSRCTVLRGGPKGLDGFPGARPEIARVRRTDDAHPIDTRGFELILPLQEALRG